MADSAFVFEGTPDNFQELVIEGSRQRPVLVDFWAAWCNPCQMLMPVVTKLAEEYGGKFHLVKVNSDEQQALASQYGVRSLPTLKLFRNGEVVKEVMGAQPESGLRALLDEFIERPGDKYIMQAQLLAEQGQFNEAESLLDQAQQEDPEHKQLPLEIARLKVLASKFDEAEDLLTALPLEQSQSPEVTQLLAQIQLARQIKDSPSPAELEQKIQSDPSDLTSHLQLAATRVMENNYEAALELYLSIMKKDRKWQDEAGRKGLLNVFELLGGQGELVSRYRRQMSSLLL